jgi:hypothetical protein
MPQGTLVFTQGWNARAQTSIPNNGGTLMAPARLIGLVALTLAMAVAVVGQSQQAHYPAADEPHTALSKGPVKILRHKIGSEYYPMLDRPSAMSAENGDMPITENERLARQKNKGYKNIPAPIAPGDARERGRLRSYARVIDDAQYVEIVIKNNDIRPIKVVEWDFAFPRYENGSLLFRYNVIAQVEINPGGKKTLMYKLPPGAKRCEVVKVVSNEKQPEKVSSFEAVCGQGINDPSLLKLSPETISINQIEFIDGSIWRRR